MNKDNYNLFFLFRQLENWAKNWCAIRAQAGIFPDSLKFLLGDAEQENFGCDSYGSCTRIAKNDVVGVTVVNG